MTKEQIIARRDAVIAERAAAAQEISRLERLRDTQFGVIQDCEHWLRAIGAEEESALMKPDLWMGTGLRKVEHRDAIAQAEEREAGRLMDMPTSEYLAAGGR